MGNGLKLTLTTRIGLHHCCFTSFCWQPHTNRCVRRQQSFIINWPLFERWFLNRYLLLASNQPLFKSWFLHRDQSLISSRPLISSWFLHRDQSLTTSNRPLKISWFLHRDQSLTSIRTLFINWPWLISRIRQQPSHCYPPNFIHRVRTFQSKPLLRPVHPETCSKSSSIHFVMTLYQTVIFYRLSFVCKLCIL